LIIGKKEFNHWNSFVVGIATKIATTTQSAMEEFLAKENLTPTHEQNRGIRALGSSR
jgi:hypothetical protein